MALSAGNGVKQVPWSSPSEWHDVYKQIYSNDTAEQTRAYETILAWKARTPRLPVGVEGTLSILQVCLRDREWSSKIDNGELPMYCENDLSLMYSTTIMRILNHISNIGHMKYTSLFRIAEGVKIPEWIVGLRHSAAHGHELPPLGVLRIAINILLEWLHEEYWAAEARIMEEYYTKEADGLEEEEESEETEGFTDLFELWTSVSLYIHAGHRLVSDIPDKHLRKTLKELRKYVLTERSKKGSDVDEYVQQADVDNVKSDKDYNLTAAQALLLSEISVYLAKNGAIIKNDLICNMLCENDAFLPDSDIMQIFLQKGDKRILKKKFLPSDMLRFWKNIIILIHKKGMLKALVLKLFKIVDDERRSKEKRTFAALWINSILYSFVQLDIAHGVCRAMEYTLKETGIELCTKDLSHRVKEQIHSSHPYMQNVLWLDISSIIPPFLLDINFLSMLLLRINEFTAGFVQPILELVTPRIDAQTKEHLLNLLKIYVFQKRNDKENIDDACEKIFTVEDLRETSIENKVQKRKKGCTKKETVHFLADKIIRNLHWKLALDHQWIECPIGLLPWQNSLKSLELKPTLPKHAVSALDSQIVAGVVNSKNLEMKSRIDWNNVLWTKKRVKRTRDDDVTVVIMNRALEIAKKQE